METLRLSCRKCKFNANSKDDYIPSKIASEYVLENGSTIKNSRLRTDGWCNSCTKFTQLFSGISVDTLINENNKIIRNNTGFFGNQKKLSSYENDLYNENLQIIEVLRKRIDLRKKCLVCNSYDVYTKDDNFTNLIHKHCGGLFNFESSVVKINLRIWDPHTPTVDKTIKIALLDANDNLVGYMERIIKVIK
jgi:hypothetical protein